MYVQCYAVLCIYITIVAMDTIHLLFVFVGIDVAVNNIRVFGVAMEMQPWVSFPMLSSYKIFFIALNNNKYKI